MKVANNQQPPSITETKESRVVISQKETATAKPKFKDLIGLLAIFLLTTIFVAEAQQRPVLPVIGVLGAGPGPHWEALRQRLRELGYIGGQNITFEYRWAHGKNELLLDHAVELVRMGAKVIVTEGTPAARAAKKATSAIPIVMAIVGDPVGSGLVANLAQPGGNITGLTSIAPDLATKQVELLKESVTRPSPLAALWNPDNPLTGRLILDRIEIASKVLRVQLQILEAKQVGEFEKAFSKMANDRINALLVVPDPTFDTQQKHLAELTIKNRLPAVYNKSVFAEAGGLLAYGAHYLDFFRRAAIYVDKILKGARPADLPVEQPTKFEFVINLKTAKQIGLTIPPNVLARADKVIR
jgi:putative ABC transport system substrate-binding protein